MMETPRACLGTKRLAPAVEFMSFGTNDLTQMTYGFSRDDGGKFIPAYLDRKLEEHDPFVTLDQRAVGRLMKMATADSKDEYEDAENETPNARGGHPTRGTLGRWRMAFQECEWFEECIGMTKNQATVPA